jgi:hypothetical protein
MARIQGDDLSCSIRTAHILLDNARACGSSTRLQALYRLRTSSLGIVGSVERWRNAQVQPEPFTVCKQNYLLKMATDLDFLQVRKQQTTTSP